MTLSGVELGVAVVGSEVGVKAMFASQIAAADEWAAATQDAGVQAARGLELPALAARRAELAYIRLGEVSSKWAEGEVLDYRAVERAAVQYQATVEGAVAKAAAAQDTALATQERGAIRYESAMIGAGRAATTYLTVPLAIAGYAAIKLSTDFQASMLRIQTYAGATAAEVKAQSASILDNAGMLPQGPVKAAEALYHLESIGIRGPRAFEDLKVAAIAAGAGMADLTDSTTALGGALVSGVKGATEAKTTMAGLVAITGEGNMTMQDLVNAMGTGLLVKAHNVGLSLREVGAAMAVLVDRGLPARRAATYLGTTFALMSAPSKEAQNALSDMGVHALDMAHMLLQPNGLLNVLEMLHAGMERVGRAQGARDIMSAFGRSRQSTGILTLIESLNAPVSNYSQKLQQYDKGVAESAQRMAAYQQSAQYKMHTALSQIEADFIKLGTAAMPYVASGLKSVSDGINSFINAFDKLPAPMREAFGAMAGFLAVGGPILLGVGLVMRGVRQLGTVMEQIGLQAKTGAAGADESLTTIGVAADGATAQVEVLQAALDKLGLTEMTVMSTPAFGGGFLVKGAPGEGVVGSTGSMFTPTPYGVRGPGGKFVALSELSAEEQQALGLATAEKAGMFSIAASGLSTFGTDMRGALSEVASAAMPAMLLGFGGMMAGSMVKGMVPGTAGKDIGNVVEGAGIGAGVGMFFPEFGGPLTGAAVGAALGGVVDGFHAIEHTGPSAEQQLRGMATAVIQLGNDAHAATFNVAQLHAKEANLRVARDQLQAQIGRDKQSVAQAPNSRQARDQLIADEAQLQALDAQIKQSQQQATAWTERHNSDLEKQRRHIANLISETQALGNVTMTVTGSSKAGGQAMADVAGHLIKIGDAAGEAKNKTQAYGQALLQMAETSKGKLQEVYYKLYDIYRETGKIPSDKQVSIAVRTTFDRNTKLLLFGLGDLAKNLDSSFKDLFKGMGVKASARSGPVPLTSQQQIAIDEAKNKYDKANIEREIRYDNQQIERLKRLRDEGKINNEQFVTQVTAYYQDRQTMEQRLRHGSSSGGAGKATSAFDKRVREDNLLAKARLDLENGQYAQAQALLAKDKSRLEMMLKEAKNAEERNAVLRQILEVEKVQKSKASSFALPLALQVAQARADALAALDPSLQGPSAMQVQLAKKAKAAAMRAINSHTLTMEGLIQAWQIVGSANAVLAQSAIGTANLYHAVSSDSITDAVKGLTRTQEMQLRERIAQSEGHRGYAPNDQGAAGSSDGQHKTKHDHGGGRGGGGGGGHPVASAPHAGGGTVIKISGPMNFYGVQNVKQLEAELSQLRRQQPGRSGSRR